MVSEAIYVFDNEEFRALARDVAGKLLVVDVDSKSQAQLEEVLLPGMTDAFHEYYRV